VRECILTALVVFYVIVGFDVSIFHSWILWCIESGETNKWFRKLGEMPKKYFGLQVLKKESCWKK